MTGRTSVQSRRLSDRTSLGGVGDQILLQATPVKARVPGPSGINLTPPT